MQSTNDRSPRAFFEEFEIYVKQHGHHRYQQAIKHSDLEEDVKTDLLREFTFWKANNGVPFWLDRQSKASRMKTATTLVKGSESCAKSSILRDEKEDIEKDSIGEY